jgi:hypothetical protein
LLKKLSILPYEKFTPYPYLYPLQGALKKADDYSAWERRYLCWIFFLAALPQHGEYELSFTRCSL